MLPFDRKPWAWKLALTVIVLTLAAAVAAPFYLHHIRHLDPPMEVLIVLLVLAIVPPNWVIFRRHLHGVEPESAASSRVVSPAYASRPAGR